jgi:DNA repair protein RecN (Recombination protein N)
MLLELRVENLLLIERARLDLAPGLNVLTGETGAGKTVLAHALDLLLGGRARSGIVRPGAVEANVEGSFELDETLIARLGDRLPAGADELVLARRVGADGRTRAYCNGRAIAVAELRELAGDLISFYGQHEHRRLMLAGVQLEILDAFCGPEQARLRADCAEAHRRVRGAEAELHRLAELAGARERELDLIEFELSEVEAVEPREDELDELEAERDRLRHLDALRAASWSGAQALSPEDAEDAGAATHAAQAAAGLDAVDGVDAALDALAQRVRAVAVEAGELGLELRRYGESLEAEPGRLDAVEERLAAIARLTRKHGGSVAAVLEHADRCRARRDELVGAELALERTTAELDGARAELQRSAEQLRAAREGEAPRLASAVQERLVALAMADASFAVEMTPTDAGVAGADQVQFMIAPNPGVPAAPLRDIASGGELSRVMLALMGAANDGGSSTLVFDEVDAGIGGHTARAVGAQLRELATDRQLLCITHLPQVASLGARHFTVTKDSSQEPALATVTLLEQGDVVSELVRMLGAADDDSAARRHARELLKAA